MHDQITTFMLFPILIPTSSRNLMSKYVSFKQNIWRITLGFTISFYFFFNQFVLLLSKILSVLHLAQYCILFIKLKTLPMLRFIKNIRRNGLFFIIYNKSICGVKLQKSHKKLHLTHKYKVSLSLWGGLLVWKTRDIWYTNAKRNCWRWN